MLHKTIETIKNALNGNDFRRKFKARQAMFAEMPVSSLVEYYLQDNEARLQKLEKFPMMIDIYNKLPRKLLLKCSRKTLKSTLISNLITLNAVRFNNYDMLYVAPQELATKYFSQNYLTPRFESPELLKIFPGFRKNDVFEKKIDFTDSLILLRYAKDDAARCRGPSTSHNFYDEVQDMLFDILPIIRETLAILPIKRETFAGTPLTTDNTISVMWDRSTQFEWVTKCEGCNHWNSLTVDNEPMKMILAHGFSCSKCSKVLNTAKGQWATFGSNSKDLVGYHLAQPLLPYYNQDTRQWDEIFKKVTNKDYSVAQCHNEVFGLPYDIGSKPITKEFLMNKSCILGNKKTDSNFTTNIFIRGRDHYRVITCGVDWGVNMETARTTFCLGGLRSDRTYEVFDTRIYKDFDYEGQIIDIAQQCNKYDAFVAADEGPDSARGIKLIQLTSPTRGQMVRYEHGNLIQRYIIPPGAVDWRNCRWGLHRSDTMTFVFNMIKKGLILFPRWDDCEEEMQDILNVFIEVKEGNYGRQMLFYRHKPDQPDDFFHALNYAACQAYVHAGDPVLNGPSSYAE